MTVEIEYCLTQTLESKFNVDFEEWSQIKSGLGFFFFFFILFRSFQIKK
jgi:hypothetical protein